MLLKLDANEFKEINPRAEFDFSCLPIPYASLKRINNNEKTTYSQTIKHKLGELLNAINKEGTNLEYSYLFTGKGSNKNNNYNNYEPIKVGLSQSVQYDWKRIEECIKQSNKGSILSIFHTHPKSIKQQHNTLYNKHKEILKKFGVKPDGLNLSLSDIYANQYLDMLCKKFGKEEIIPESTVLMHDGTLVSFSTKNGVLLTSAKRLKLNKQHKKEDFEATK